MESLFILIPLSVGIVFAAVWIFLRMSKDGQFDDLEGPAWRILQDEDDPGGGPKEPTARDERPT
ncbi:cbb3-type cytochrome oxidase assembly protein CcoS [Derxia gummosa]|uniref:Cbb3-type cytochrome oxidase assembly protein CcoS n=1 Tax=Derxia gummosa DSM 723 TaxID=1121388 RepID=A0A8B6X6W2_9BURK|nr:cbb3-type cytochrome oxidase assembly protein CcoS [Derxia gummosa]